MRVVQVSAHYPPNFVSGGTLVPRRIAHDLAARGHEVFVYAGFLDEERQPLEGWEEVDGHGVTIRWVVTTPWTAWTDPLNTLNPGVEADFESWLSDVRPDVVHLHSLQTFGGGLLPVARRAGAVVIVTMHDFWWTCARQFLVSPEIRPCSLVVDCGTCPCAVDHEWLERRNARLRPALGAADLVLAPSASAARVLVANGVDPAMVRVDENGLPGGGTVRPVRPAADLTAPLRFLYAGGENPMKGLGVLLEAIGGVPADGTWTLDLYGVDGDARPLPADVMARPPYAPSELSEILAGHDVLVLPSVMRESHSILTREALQAGLAVVCSDTLGPEEAVQHAINGLVVPAGDAAALRAALVRMIGDRAAVRRMQEAPPAAPIRAFVDQVDGLERTYRELVAARTAPDDATVPDLMSPTVRRAEDGLLQRVLFVAGIQGAPLRYRARLPAEALRLLGRDVEVRHYRDPELPRLTAWADAVVLYRVPATTQVVDLVRSIRERGRPVPVLFDVDDLIFDPTLVGQVHGLAALSPADRDLWWRGVARYRTTMELCDGYVGSTPALCRRAEEAVGLPAFLFANGVGIGLAQASDDAVARGRTAGPPRIGYFSGTSTHDADWAHIEPAVVEVLRARPDVELRIGGLLRTGPALEELGARVVRLPMLPWHELPGHLHDLDVNLAPLAPGTPFNEAKSAIKWLEAALVETPTVASPTEPFLDAVDPGRTGLLAGATQEWADAIGSLLDDPLLARRIGTQARREALLRWSPHLQARRYAEILREAAHRVRTDGPRTTSGWEPVLDDEPLDAAESWLEPFDAHPAASRPAAPTGSGVSEGSRRLAILRWAPWRLRRS